MVIIPWFYDKILVTSDVQSVTATVVGEYTIDIQCLFIHGSDAVGCKVVLVSDHPGVNNETKTLIRRNTFAFAQLKLTHQLGCYCVSSGGSRGGSWGAMDPPFPG